MQHIATALEPASWLRIRRAHSAKRIVTGLAIVLLLTAVDRLFLPRRPTAAIDLPYPTAVVANRSGHEILILSTPKGVSSQYKMDCVVESYSLPRLCRRQKIGVLNADGVQVSLASSGKLLAFRDWKGMRILDPDSLIERFRVPAYRQHSLTDFVYSADGRWMAARTEAVLRTRNPDMGVLLFRLDRIAEPKVFSDPNIHSVGFSADSSQLVYATGSDVKFVSLEGDDVVSLAPTLGRNGSIESICIQTRGSLVAVLISSDEIQFWNIRERRLTGRFQYKMFHPYSRSPSAFVADDSVLIVSGMLTGRRPRLVLRAPFLITEPTMKMGWTAIDVRTGARLWSHTPDKKVDSITAIPGSNQFLVCQLGRVELWNAR